MELNYKLAFLFLTIGAVALANVSSSTSVPCRESFACPNGQTIGCQGFGPHAACSPWVQNGIQVGVMCTDDQGTHASSCGNWAIASAARTISCSGTCLIRDTFEQPGSGVWESRNVWGSSYDEMASMCGGFCQQSGGNAFMNNYISDCHIRDYRCTQH